MGRLQEKCRAKKRAGPTCCLSSSRCGRVLLLLRAFWNRTHLYLVTPLSGGGTLLQNINWLGIEEDLAKRWFQQILLGMGYIHGKVRRRSRAYGHFISILSREIICRELHACVRRYTPR